MFNNPQDRELVNSVLECGAEPKYWRWVAAMFEFVLKPLEKMRRWGMVCKCHVEWRRRHKRKPKCGRASRRLIEVREFVKVERGKFLHKANHLRADEVGGDVPLHKLIAHTLRNVAGHLQLKFKFLDCLPYLFVFAATQAGAQEILDHLEQTEPERRGPCTRCWAEHFLGDIKAVAAGEEPSARLRAEVKRLENIPMDEGPGESYHRGTNWAKTRASGATREYIICVQRRDQNLARALRWLDTHGRRGTSVVNYEWFNFKRIVKGPVANKRARYTRKKMTDKLCFKTFYRFDSADQEDLPRTDVS